MNPFEYTESITIGLSNACNQAWLHEKCPLNLGMLEPGVIREPQTLPIAIVQSVMNVLGKYKYGGILAFHLYNEPLQDPRLFLLLWLALDTCPKAEIQIVTNGYNLTPTLARELIAYGVKKIVVSLTGSENARAVMRKRAEVLQQDVGNVDYNPDHMMDDRLLIYDVPKADPREPCHAPLSQVVIRHDGMVGLCCFDWKGEHSFGDLRKQSLEAILRSKGIRQAHEELLKGYRERQLCRQCGRSR